MTGSALTARRVLSWVGLGLLALGAVAVEVIVLCVGEPAGKLVQPLVAVLTLALAIAPWLWRWGRLAGTGRLTLADAANQLAEQVGGLWKGEAAARQLTTAMPVRWRWSPRQVTGSAADAASGSGSIRFDPLPGVEPVTAETLQAGGLEDLFGVYGGLHSGRLVIHGGPGSGKTGAAILLLLDALKHRTGIGKPEERARVPVPVYVTAHGWDPTSQSLINWLAGRLVRDNEFLRAPEYGRDAAVRLLKGGYVAVILDGLDEMPEELRSEALRALDTQATFRLVVLTRTKEIVAAVSSGTHLRGAAALELCPINATQAADHLTRCQIQPPQSWQNLVEHLGRDADSPVAQALDTPLMLTLARDIYRSGGQADELLDRDRFPTRETIEDHLLDQVLPAAYTHRPGEPTPLYTDDQAKRWLGYLAWCMGQDGKTQDLAWWHIPRWVPAWPRALAIVVVLDLVIATYNGLWFWLAAGAGLTDVLTTMFLGLLAWLSYALMFGLGLAVVSGPPRDNTSRIRKALLAGLMIGLAFGLFSALLAVGEFNFVAGTINSLSAWLVIGLGFILVTDPGTRLPRQENRRGWWNKTDRRAALAAGLVTGLAVELVWGLIGITAWLLGLSDHLWLTLPEQLGLWPGFTGGLGLWLGLPGGLGLWLGLPGGLGLWLGLPGGLWSGFSDGLLFALGFGFAAGLARRSCQQKSDRPDARRILMAAIIGSVIAINFEVVLGFAFLVTAVFGGRPPQQLRQRQWRTGLGTVLVVGLVAGILAGIGPGLLIGLARGLWLGAAFGLVSGFGFGLVFAVATALGQPSTRAASPLDPQSLRDRERQFGLLVGMGVGFIVGLLYVLQSELYGLGLVTELLDGLFHGVVVGLGAWLVSSAIWSARLACAQLRRRGGTPMRLLRFLDDARKREILRTVGPVYQFRHARLQDRLAQLYEDTLPVQKVRGSWTAHPTPAPHGVTGGLDTAWAAKPPIPPYSELGLHQPEECGSGIDAIPELHSQE